ncbi:unnamed protein product [Brassica oleracea]
MECFPRGAICGRKTTDKKHCDRSQVQEMWPHRIYKSSIFQCDFAQKVWNFAPFSSTFDSSGLIDLAVNLEDLMSLICLPSTGFPSEGLSPWIMWSLWTARNNMIFNKKISSPEDVVSKAVYFAREWQGAQEPNTPTKRLKPATESNLENTCTVHTDVAWREDVGVAGLGWIIYKSAMRSTYGSHCRYVSSPLVAEALALREAMFIKCLICLSDSSQMVPPGNQHLKSMDCLWILSA